MRVCGAPADAILHAPARCSRRCPGVLILDLTGLDWIDATALRIIHQTLERGSQSGILVLVVGCSPLTAESPSRSSALPESVVFDLLDDAVQRARIHLLRDRGHPPQL